MEPARAVPPPVPDWDRQGPAQHRNDNQHPASDLRSLSRHRSLRSNEYSGRPTSYSHAPHASVYPPLFRCSSNILSQKSLGDYRLSKSVSRKSVMNIWPGLCVNNNDGRACMATACGVTPQAQNTGVSPGRISTGSPKSGRAISWMPMAAGSPTCTGAPCASGKRRQMPAAAYA